MDENLPVEGGFTKRTDWRTDKKLITFSFVKKYCPHKIVRDEKMGAYYCPEIERRPKSKVYNDCRGKWCPIWKKLE